ncbi:Inorganic triphosphatase YgiF, contains CYTH and CHAD domains [Cryobacterium psychrotolerans]|uniref:Inorganic triphosphatase YgiF, contains CYTH and CHAD domains n=1 Tax=Cryobacterium psychrotolerans TaxID=386301 RepID=A0A1G8XAA1_9MICO|nr:MULTISPECIES: CYTH and CHAD domain-containing protein [Cryobacterium]TFD45763.1 CYTH and CHAD domain-containing protein [Cryobacterium sp. TMT1-2-1]TFD82978.1 CYTH and CHAD domain-containing protein [Cryobacterium psychrotolerans]SDJ87413.1 Inorganic triphosphatase YgiF, contains CYTH and CHAD domains [Cryobacterium psychrotolerans]
MAAHTQAEIERKYDVDAAASVPDLTAADGIAAARQLEPVTLTAVYFDTANLDLAAHRMILRRREGGPDEGWHIKKPAKEGRTELHWPLGSGTTIPDEVLDPVRAIVRDRALSPLARINTVRTAVHLLDERGEAVAELADDVVSASDARGGTLRTWREWEVELLPAAPDTKKARSRLLDAIERVLLEAGATPSSSVAKVAQALGAESLTDVVPGIGAVADAIAGTAASVVVAAVRRLTAALENADPAVRADQPDAVHQMRRAVRRLSNVLAGNGRLFDAEAVRALRDGLAWLGGSLGDARDAEVSGKRAVRELDAVPAHPSDAAVQARLVADARRGYTEAHQRVRRLMSSPRYYRLLDALDDFAARPPLTKRWSHPAVKEIRRQLRRDIARLRTRARRAAAAGPVDREAALHDVRKAVRRLRNAVDAVRPEAAAVLGAKKGRALRRISAAAKPIETSLGERHDLVLFAGQLEFASASANEAGEETFVYGMLTARAASELGAPPADLDSSVRRIARLARTF